MAKPNRFVWSKDDFVVLRVGQTEKYDHARSEYEQRCNFELLKSIYEKDGADVDKRLRALLRDTFKKVQRDVEDLDKMGNLTPNAIANFKVASSPGVVAVLREHLVGAWRKARDAAVRELPANVAGKIGTVLRYKWDERAKVYNHKFSSTQIDLPKDLQTKFGEWVATYIKPEEFYPDEEVGEYHVTVRYGLHTEDAVPVGDILASHRPAKALLGKIELFTSHPDYDVLIVHIDSPDLVKLNAALAELPHTDTHPGYTPHATLAYLKKGAGDKWAGNMDFAGQSFEASEVKFSSSNESVESIKLEGKKLNSRKKSYAAGFNPVEALNYLAGKSVVVKGIIDDELTKRVRLILLNYLKGGDLLKDVQQQIATVFEPYVGDPEKIVPSGITRTPEDVMQAYRLENIIRTNTTDALMQGRFAVADAADDYIVGYELSAILDDRTCFQEGTRIELAHGRTAPIESVKPGDFIRSGSGNARRVLAAWRYPARRWRRLLFDNGMEVVCTETHKFWTKTPAGFEWIESHHLEAMEAQVAVEPSYESLKHETVPSVWPRVPALQQQSAQVLLGDVLSDVEGDLLTEDKAVQELREGPTEESRYEKEILLQEMFYSIFPNGENLPIMWEYFPYNEKGPSSRSGQILQSRVLSKDEKKSGSQEVSSLPQDISNTGEQRGAISRLLDSMREGTETEEYPVQEGSRQVPRVRELDNPQFEAERDSWQQTPQVVQWGLPQEMVRSKSSRDYMSGLRENIQVEKEAQRDILFGPLLSRLPDSDENGTNGGSGPNINGSKVPEAIPARNVYDRFRPDRLRNRARNRRDLLARAEAGCRSAEGRGDQERWNGSSSFSMQSGDSHRRRFTAENANHSHIPSATRTALLVSNTAFAKVQWAYDLEIEGDHSYIAEGLIAHNTEICDEADGTIIRANDPRLPSLTPPLFYQCRSTLVFITTDDLPVKWSTDAHIDKVVRMRTESGFQ